MVSEDKITMKRGNITLILEPYGNKNKWSVSVVKNLPPTDNKYGQEWLQTKILHTYASAKSEFMKGLDGMCARELDFEDVCKRTFGYYDPEYFTYKL